MKPVKVKEHNIFGCYSQKPNSKRIYFGSNSYVFDVQGRMEALPNGVVVSYEAHNHWERKGKEGHYQKVDATANEGVLMPSVGYQLVTVVDELFNSFGRGSFKLDPMSLFYERQGENLMMLKYTNLIETRYMFVDRDFYELACDLFKQDTEDATEPDDDGETSFYTDEEEKYIYVMRGSLPKGIIIPFKVPDHEVTWSGVETVASIAEHKAKKAKGDVSVEVEAV